MYGGGFWSLYLYWNKWVAGVARRFRWSGGRLLSQSHTFEASFKVPRLIFLDVRILNNAHQSSPDPRSALKL